MTLGWCHGGGIQPPSPRRGKAGDTPDHILSIRKKWKNGKMEMRKQ